MRSGLRGVAFGLAALGIVSMAFWAREDFVGILLAIGAVGSLALVAGWRSDWLGAGMIYLGSIAGTSIAGNPANIPGMARLGGVVVVLGFVLGSLLEYAFRRWYRPGPGSALSIPLEASDAAGAAATHTQGQGPAPVGDGMTWSQTASRSRYVAYGVLGWTIPGLVALPLAWRHESSGGEAVLFAVLVWWALGAVGCAVAGAMVSLGIERAGSATDAFMEGFVGVCFAWLAALAVSMLVETFVGVLHLGAAALLIPIPFVFGYGIAFGVGFATRRR